MVNFQKLAEDLNECVVEKLFIRVGRYKGEYYVGDDEFITITGDLFIMTNSWNLFRVVSDDSSIVDDFDILDSNAIITPVKDLKNSSIFRDEVDVGDKSSLRKYFNLNDEIENEMFECVQSIPIRFREDALDIFCFKEDREMWDLKSVDKAWTYFLEYVLQEMTEEENKQYGFKSDKNA